MSDKELTTLFDNASLGLNHYKNNDLGIKVIAKEKKSPDLIVVLTAIEIQQLIDFLKIHYKEMME